MQGKIAFCSLLPSGTRYVSGLKRLGNFLLSLYPVLFLLRCVRVYFYPVGRARYWPACAHTHKRTHTFPEIYRSTHTNRPFLSCDAGLVIVDVVIGDTFQQHLEGDLRCECVYLGMCLRVKSWGALNQIHRTSSISRS